MKNCKKKKKKWKTAQKKKKKKNWKNAKKKKKNRYTNIASLL